MSGRVWIGALAVRRIGMLLLTLLAVSACTQARSDLPPMMQSTSLSPVASPTSFVLPTASPSKAVIVGRIVSSAFLNAKPLDQNDSVVGQGVLE